MEGETQMSRRAKLDKIDAEIARMEVECELEKSGVGDKHIGSNYNSVGGIGKQGMLMASAFNPFSWKAVTGKRATLSPVEQAGAFISGVLIPSIERLKLILKRDDVSYEEFKSSEIVNYVSLKGYVVNYMPSNQWKIMIGDKVYILFLFTSDDVKVRILKIIPSQAIPSMSSIKELLCWSGDPKTNLTAVIGAVYTQIEKLHTSDDSRIAGKTR
jgi:hypothetical protein